MEVEQNCPNSRHITFSITSLIIVGWVVTFFIAPYDDKFSLYALPIETAISIFWILWLAYSRNWCICRRKNEEQVRNEAQLRDLELQRENTNNSTR